MRRSVSMVLASLAFPAIAALIVPVPSMAQELGDANWTRTVSSDGQFSIEMPCDADEIEQPAIPSAGKAGVPDVSGLILCHHRDMLYSAVLWTAQIEAGFTGPGMFDEFLEAAENDADEHYTFQAHEIDGRRAITISEMPGQGVTRANAIELSRGEGLLMISAIGSFEEEYDISETQKATDRFMESLELAE